MVNKVFCYSIEEAKSHKNHTSIGKMILQCVGMTFLMIAAIIVSIFVFEDFWIQSMIVIMILFIIGVICYAIKFSKKFRTQLVAFAADDQNNVYCVTKFSNAGTFFIGGLAAEGVLDALLKQNNSTAGNVANAAGTAMALYSLNNSAKLMQSTELITKTVESAENVTGADVKQILKVHSYTQDKHKVKLNCDYKIMRGGKIKQNKTLTIYKSYNNFVDLMNIILTKK